MHAIGLRRFTRIIVGTVKITLIGISVPTIDLPNRNEGRARRSEREWTPDPLNFWQEH